MTVFSITPARGNSEIGVCDTGGILVGNGVAVGTVVGVKVGIRVGVAVGVPPPSGVGEGLPCPPIFMFNGVKGQMTISAESDERLILVSASLPLTQSKDKTVAPAALAVRLRV